ncbi:helix-turn-helix transcriptional regulator [Actinoplanes friuliensis]|uniref:LuxR family transcriptional regulator n=1 Tax=Actinoplanes friuliensis DSM 7358 TaxID=1246995 RepID=U5VQH4_9ACTN|nr:helix-turn-helix transcriptional regulator [Actinoplanes friuliensis]AGZ39054.1 LuxR family transcriptional regulator [Actinoplanes friuliensis DSM 7358]
MTVDVVAAEGVPVVTSSVPIGAALPSLVRWGLSSDADLVFRTLATFGPRPRRVLSSELGLPVRRTDQALAELHECDAVVSTDDSRAAARIWTARRPAEVVTALRTRRLQIVNAEARERSHHAVLRALRATPVGRDLPLVTAPGTPGTCADGVRYLSSRDRARTRLAEVLGSDIRDFLTMSNDQAIDAESARAAAPLDLALLARGVRVRVLALPPADGDPLDVSGHLVNGTSFQRRESPGVPLKLVIVDHRISLFPADPANLERGYLEVSRPSVVQALIRLFERQWDGAAAHLALPAIRLSEREQKLITLLAAGHTDQSAAQHLRISARSVTGILRALMDRLGVENRFQLGLALGALRVAAPPSLALPDQES